MIVGIIKIGTGLVALEEFRKAEDESLAVDEFCSEYSPTLDTSDYLGVNGDSLDLQKNWGWDFSETAPVLKEVVIVLNKVYALSDRNIEPILPELKKNSRNGYILFNEIIATYFGLRFASGELTEDNIDYCYTKLMPVATMLIRGHFKQARKRLSKLFINGVTEEDINNGYTQEVHDNIINDINNYLNQ
jgi:hypothetical protein